MRALIIVGLIVVLGGCGAEAPQPPAVWDGALETYGSLRGIFHDDAIGSAVELDALLPDDTLHAVGALEALAGEVTIVGGRTYLSYPEGEGSRTELVERPGAGAALLVAARVPAWVELATRRPIAFEALDEAIAGLAGRVGWSSNDRFPFIVDGVLEQLEWHVIDGSRLTAGGGSHRDHLAASTSTRQERVRATLVGFHSPRDQGVFTHANSRTHVHCVVPEPIGAGHVEHVVIPAGVTVRFPARDVLPDADSVP